MKKLLLIIGLLCALPAFGQSRQAVNVSSPAVLRVIPSTTSYTDSQGNVWGSDAGNATGGAITATTATITKTLPATTDQKLYTANRYANFLTTFTENFTVANGSYAVTMKFAETYWTVAGKRVFNVSINGTPALTNFDIFKTAGGENIGIDEVIPVTVTTGAIAIVFTTVTDNAQVNAISVIPTTVPTPPAPPVVTTTSVTVTAGLACGATPPQPIVAAGLSWQASPTTGVTNYNVYRSTTSGSGYAKIGSTTTALTYTDSTITGNATYYYVVTALVGTAESVYSNQVSIAIP